MNFMRTALLLAAMTALFMAIGYVAGGKGGMAIAFIIALGMNFFSYWFSDKMVLSTYGAREVDDQSAPELVQMVRQLATRAQLPMPKVYIIDNEQPNAFATGRDHAHAAVAVSSGLMNSLSREEVAGVIAHELAHIKNYDILTMTMTATIAGAIGMVANMAVFSGQNRENNGIGLIGGIAMMILAPLAAMIVQMAVSRTREYEADRLGGEIVGNPIFLATALERIAGEAHVVENPEAERNPATAHMFIINPLSGQRMDNLFSTHPATENRVAALYQQARQMGIGNYQPQPQQPGYGQQPYGRPGGAPRGPWG